MKSLILFLIFSSVLVFPQENFEDKTLSPYFFIKSDDPEIDKMPLKSTSVSVKIAGIIADVTVKQVYKNEGEKTIEAIYVFPASTRAAVYGLKMKIGERTIVAKIKERGEAREIYERAKNEGRTASLLEQQRPNVFQMNVANILPQDTIEVELKYTEILKLEEKIYEFVYPTVVGPRYSNIKESEANPSEKWIKSPYFLEKEKPSYTFDLNLTISAGIPIYEVSSPSHKINVNFENLEKAKVNLDESEKYSGNRDFILKYKLSGKKIEEGILLYEKEGEKFFLLMLEPPEKVTGLEIPPREYIFIVDVSGSMYGFPLEISKDVIKKILFNLKPSDKFNILLFSGSSYVLSEKSISATEENIKRAISVIDRQRGGGGTEILPALKRALSLPRDENLSTTIIVLTDGYVTVEKEVFQIIRENLNKANLFSFGIGTSVNRFLIEGMARAGMAESFIVTRPDEAEEAVKKFQNVISFPVLTDIKINFNGFYVYDVEPESIPDLFIEKPLYVFGKYKGKPEGVIEIKGIKGDGVFKKSINVYEEEPSKENSALPFLWARHKISILSDYESLARSEENKDQIINLGLKYNLLTQYTSFVAEDSLARNKEGIIETVNQPLPLPEGVSNYALGCGAQVAQLSKLRYSKDKSLELINDEEKKKEREEPVAKILPSNKNFHSKIFSLIVSEEKFREVIKNLIKKSLNSFSFCNKKGTKGKMNLKITLDVNGNLKDVKIIRSELEKEMERCVIEKIKNIDFKEIKNTNKLEVNLILEFYV